MRFTSEQPFIHPHDQHSCGATGCLHGFHGTRRAFLRSGILGGAAVGLSACVTKNRATGQNTFTGFSSLEDDMKIGREQHPQLVKAFGGEYENPRLQRYVEKIGTELARFAEYQEFQYRFTILNSPIINAFALPGGYCYVSRGLITLASNEAELAGVIAHEIGHVNARHTAQRIAQSQLAQGVLLGAVLLSGSRAVGQLGGAIAGTVLKGFSREQELEADGLGMRYMGQSGYDPHAMVGFLDTMRDHSQIEAEKRGLPKETVDERNINATHPRTIERVQQAKTLAQTYGEADQVTNRDRYLESVNGIIYGDDPRQGIVRGTRFIHAPLRFTFDVPQGWQIQNGETQVTAQKSGLDAAIVFDAAKRATRDVMTYLTEEWANDITLSNVEQIDINGVRAATAQARVNGKDYRAVAIQGEEDQIFRFRFISEPSITTSLSRPFRETTYSFRRLSAEEARKVQPYRILVVPIAPGDTVASLSASFPAGKFSQAAFRVINNLKPDDPLPETGRIKTVIGGTLS